MAKIKDVVNIKSGYANFVELKSAFEATRENADRMAMYRPTKAHRRAFERICRGLFQPTDKKFYLLSGSYGTGKSHLCLMAANVLSRSSGDPAIAGFYENYRKLDSEAEKRLYNIRKDGQYLVAMCDYHSGQRSGGGRRRIEDNDTSLLEELDALVEPLSRGDPESPLRWTCKSTHALAQELSNLNHPISHEKVAQLLRSQQYSLQSNRKTEEGNDHPDRDAQFRHINALVQSALDSGEPVISVATKKKELIGNYQNNGRQWRKEKDPDSVNGHDFPNPEVPRAYPYGIYDIGQNRGFVKIGTDHNTSSFAVASIRGWWIHEGKKLYKNAEHLLITADSGGSNGYRVKRWKLELQKLANRIGVEIVVCHFPPGTSKWNKVEHRLFSFVTPNWRGEPLHDYETIVSLIAGTTTTKGLKVSCYLDHRKYPIGKKVSDIEMASINIESGNFYGEWNYTIKPRHSSFIV